LFIKKSRIETRGKHIILNETARRKMIKYENGEISSEIQGFKKMDFIPISKMQIHN
jgi:hypothetical protein